VGVAFWGLAREIKERKGLYGLRRIDPVKKHHQLEEEAAPMLRLLGVGERCVWLDLSSIRALRPVMRRLGLGAREMRVLWFPVFFSFAMVSNQCELFICLDLVKNREASIQR
jgi:hypothetical protein